MRRGIQWATLLLLLLSPATTWSCEPILPLAQLLGGSSALGPLIWQQSLIWLAAAVALKCGAFAFFERRITWQRALVAMLLANVLSTIPGILVAALTSSMSGIIFAIPLMLLLGIMVGRRAAGPLGEKKHWITGGSVAIGFLIFCLISVLLYQFADEALAGRHYTSHWVLKFLFVALVAVTGIMISSALEEWTIGLLSRKSHPNLFFYTSVIRANYVTLAMVLCVAALHMLPQRLHSPHFLASCLRGICAALGLS